MNYVEQIRQIYADPNLLTLDEKRTRSYEIKGSAYRGVVAQIVNEPWTDGDLTVNVTSLEVDDKHRVVVQCEAWRDGAKLTLDLPFIYVNPPLIHQGAEDPRAALCQILVDAVSRVN